MNNVLVSQPPAGVLGPTLLLVAPQVEILRAFDRTHAVLKNPGIIGAPLPASAASDTPLSLTFMGLI